MAHRLREEIGLLYFTRCTTARAHASLLARQPAWAMPAITSPVPMGAMDAEQRAFLLSIKLELDSFTAATSNLKMEGQGLRASIRPES